MYPHSLCSFPLPLPWPLTALQHSASHLGFCYSASISWAHRLLEMILLLLRKQELLAILDQSHHCCTSLVSMPYRVALPQTPSCFPGTFHLGNSHVFHQIIWWSFFFPHGRLNWCICTLTCLSNP